MKKKEADIIIKNGQILTINKEMEIIQKGVVIIKAGKIIAVGKKRYLQKYSAKKEIDAKGGIIMPGMINAHCHLPMIAFRGLGEEGIKDRLMGYFMPLEKKMLNRKLIYNATIHGAIDMAMSGVTTYADMYYHVDEMARATKKIGLRAVLGETIIGFPVVDAPKAYGGLKYAKGLIKKFKKEELISLALAPHAPYTVVKNELLKVKKLADKHKLLIHIHAAEFADEKNQIEDNEENLSTIQYLDSIGFLDQNVILAHCNYTNNKDLKIIKKRGAKIAHNPMANAKGATGLARIIEARQLGIPIGLGTDGPMGSNVVSLFKVMTYATTIQRIRKMDRTLLPPNEVVRMATMGGAETLGLLDKIGSIEKGKLADLILIETQSSNMMPNYNPYATLVFQANPHNVQTTIINGKLVMENRKLLSYDREKNKKNMEKLSKRIQTYGEKLAKKAKLLVSVHPNLK